MKIKQKAFFDGWCTPKKILDAIYAFGVIALDPCWNKDSLVKALVTFTKEDDGLSQAWNHYTNAGDLIYINPPFNCETLEFVSERAYAVANFHKREVIFLSPVKSDQEWFQCALQDADSVCFLKGRVPFLKEGVEKKGSQFCCCLFYYGKRVERFYETFKTLGACGSRMRGAA